ncbi:MAG: Hsp20/alpha crystallin family protein [Gaiellales bacterium]
MATLVRWEPFRELAGLQSEMGRLMNGLFDGPGRATQSWVPALDVWETEGELVYAFDLPGIDESEVSIEVHDDTLTVTAKREKSIEETGDKFVRFERRYGTFSRAVGLPAGADDSKIAAAYVNGVLEVRVPKPAEAKPRKIAIGGSLPDVESTSSAA